MKNLLLSICLIVIVSSVSAQQPLASNTVAKNKITSKAASFNWSKTTVDLGELKLNKPVTHEFTFINTGNTPLVISSVKASCGCTITSYTKSPVAEGSSGFVTVTYNAASLGVFTKTITVTSNTEEGNTLLVIKGEVVE
jgi:hypothetical protein